MMNSDDFIRIVERNRSIRLPGPRVDVKEPQNITREKAIIVGLHVCLTCYCANRFTSALRSKMNKWTAVSIVGSGTAILNLLFFRALLKNAPPSVHALITIASVATYLGNQYFKE